MEEFSIISVPLVDLIHGSFNEMTKEMQAEVLEMRGGPEWINFVFNPFLNTHLNYPLNDLENVLTLYDSKDDTIDCFISCFEGVPVGCSIVCSSEAYSLILALYIESDFRGLGVGESTLDYIRSIYEDKKVYAFTFPGNKDSKNMFERFGMKTQLMVVS